MTEERTRPGVTDQCEQPKAEMPRPEHPRLGPLRAEHEDQQGRPSRTSGGAGAGSRQTLRRKALFGI